MRIAFFVDAFPDLALTFIIDQVVGLLERGHDVRIFAFARGRLDRSHPVVRDYDLLDRTTWIGPAGKGLPRALRAASTAIGHPAAARFALRSRRAAGDSLRTHRSLFARAHLGSDGVFDAIHCHFAPNGVTAVLLRRAGALSGPIVTTYHGYDMREGIPSDGAIYAPLRDEGDLHLSISSYNARLLRSWDFPDERIVSHRVGIAVEDFPFRPRHPQRTGAIRMVTVANLVPVKALDVLVDAVAALREDLPGLSLRVIGEGPERAALAERIRSRGLEDVVELVGGRSRPEVVEELGRADLFVLPSLAEATPVALMEAQACGLPVIATEVGAVDEVIVPDQSGVLVAPGDVDGLARAIAGLARTPERWEDMGRRGRRHVEATFDLPRLVTQLEEIYERAALTRRASV